MKVGVKEENGHWYLDTDIYEKLPKTELAMIATETLGMAFEPEQYYENPDGTPIVFCLDYFGGRRDIHPLPGPFAEAEAAKKVLW